MVGIKSIVEALKNYNAASELTLSNIYSSVAKNIPIYPLILDFSKEWHKEFINVDELGAEIVDLSAEEIPLPYDGHYGKALKITLNVGETKYLRLPTLTWENFPYPVISIRLYSNGVKATLYGSYSGAWPVLNTDNEWVMISCRSHSNRQNILKLESTNGGVIYITDIYLNTRLTDNYIRSVPNQSLDGSTTYNYEVWFPIFGKKRLSLRLAVTIAGDGTNPCNVDIYLHTSDGSKLVASVSQISATPSAKWIVGIPILFDEHYKADVAMALTITVSGYGLFKEYSAFLGTYDDTFYKLNGLKTASASNASTTVTTYSLIDNNGRGNRYKNAVINISVPSTGGSAEILINGVSVGSWGAGASVTFNVPEDIDIWKVEVNLAGDGTNPATAEFSGLELLGAYIVRR